MKKYIYSALMLGLVFGVSSCDTDRDDNPILTQATEFKLNTPAYANLLVDLASSDALQFTYSQPNWEFPIVCNYTLQYSLTGTFNHSVDEAEADENIVADYQESDIANECIMSVPAANFAKGLQQLGKWPEGTLPSEVKVTARVKAVPSQGSLVNQSQVAKYSIYSNTVELRFTPYYVELSDAPIVMWYLVGNLFGGKWGSEIGNNALPMFMIPDYQYDKKDGTGEVVYTNYFVTGTYDDGTEDSQAGFKIQPSTFNWNYGMTGDSGQKGSIIYRNNGDDGGHILAPADGYYTIRMNTSKNSAEFEKLDITPTNYGTICLSGDFNGWSDTPMLPYNKEGVENHTWYQLLNISEDDIAATGKATCEFKFKGEGSWDNNWGYGATNGEVNFRGLCSQGGNNIGLPAGKWCVSFCDIDGTFSVVAAN